MVVLCFHSCLLSVLLTGPFLLVVNFYRKLFAHSFCCLFCSVGNLLQGTSTSIFAKGEEGWRKNERGREEEKAVQMVNFPFFPNFQPHAYICIHVRSLQKYHICSIGHHSWIVVAPSDVQNKIVTTFEQRPQLIFE